MKGFASAFLCVIWIMCLLGGCAAPADLTVTCRDISLVLPAGSMELTDISSAGSADFLYGKNTLIVMGLSERKDSLGEMTLEQYTALVVRGNGLDVTWEKIPEGCRFAYEASVEGDIFTYVAVTCESGESFWIIQCYCPKGTLTGNMDVINRILSSVSPLPAAGN